MRRSEYFTFLQHVQGFCKPLGKFPKFVQIITPRLHSDPMINSTQTDFGIIFEQVVGSALKAAGFSLQANSTHQARGLFRYCKALAQGKKVYVEFQMLVYGNAPSRFRITLMRNEGADARDIHDPERVEITLSRLIWEQFEVRQLDSPDSWWIFASPQGMAHAIAHAGRLLFGFGIPWLEGRLAPGALTESDAQD